MSRNSNKRSLVISAVIVAVVVVAITSVAGSLIVGEPEDSTSKSSDDPRIIPWRHVHGVGLDPANGDILYIATHGDFYQSHSDGPPVKVDKVRADYMAFNAPPASGVPLYASGHPSTGGITWESVSKVLEPPVDFHAMAISRHDPNVLIGFDSGARGLFKTSDAGKNWETLEYPEYISALEISPDDSQIIFAGTGKGIFKSSDNGKSWIQIGAYRGLTVFALAFDDKGVLFSSVDTFGLIRSDDLGESWQDLDDLDLTVTSITADSESNNLYIAGYSSGGFQEVYKIPYDISSYQVIGTNKGLK